MQISGGIDDRWFWFKYSDVRPGHVGKQKNRTDVVSDSACRRIELAFAAYMNG